MPKENKETKSPQKKVSRKRSTKKKIILKKSIKAKKMVSIHEKDINEQASPKRMRRSSLISFTMEDVYEILKQNQEESSKNSPLSPQPEQNKKITEVKLKKKIIEVPRAKTRLTAASLSDILGYSSTPDKSSNNLSKAENVPAKWKKFYQLLIDLRGKIQKELTQRTKDTLKRSAKEDSGDLSSYGQHMGDAGTELSDRDLALSLVSSEQLTLKEVNAALERIHSGTYGICEVTEKPIDHERLSAIPYTRYSIEGQQQKESTSKKTSFQGGVFARSAEDSAEFSIEEE